MSTAAARSLCSFALLTATSCSLLNAPKTAAGSSCEERADACDPVATCVDEDMAFRCVCPAGYRDVHGDGTVCRDRDECQDGSAECDPRARCDNQDGGYRCVCPDGYRSEDEGRSCQAIDPCGTDEHTCDPATELCERIARTEFVCNCRAGFVRVAGACVNVDNCGDGEHRCEPPAQCVDDGGSYHCECPSGVAMSDRWSCAHFDPCVDAACGPHAECVPGGVRYSCECLAGYERTTDARCLDIDECAATPCREPGSCVNREGDFECSCPAYYHLSADALGCDSALRRAYRFAGTPPYPRFDSEGNLLLAGSFEGVLQQCGPSAPSAGGDDVFVARYEPSGACTSSTFGGTGSESLIALGVTPSGDPVLVFSYFGQLTFGDDMVDSQGVAADVVVKVDAASGRALWGRSFANARLASVVSDPAGDLLLAGQAVAGADLGDQTRRGAFDDAVLLKLSGDDGQLLWARSGTGASPALGTSVAVDPAGAIYLTGAFANDVTFEPTQLVGAPDTFASDGLGYRNGFLARFSASGALVWLELLRGNFVRSPSTPWPLLSATLPDGAVVVAGGFRGELALETTVASAGQSDAFVAVFEPATGGLRWIRSYGGPREDGIESIAVGADGGIRLAGAFAGTARFGDITLESVPEIPLLVDSSDVFLAQLDSAGQLRWLHGYGGTAFEGMPRIALGPDGAIVVSARSEGAFQADQLAIEAADDLVGLVLELQP